MNHDIQNFVSKPFFNSESLLSHSNHYPKISVITPSYNQAEFIERTILSILNQNYPNLEYIIVDDKSPDHSNQIIEKYSSYLQLIGDGINRGQTAAINYGLRKATGEILAFQNADDIYAPNAFFEVAKAYTQNESASAFFGNLYIIDENDAITNAMRMVPFSLDEHIGLGMQAHNQSLFFKKEVLLQLGYLDEKYNYSFDYEFILRLGASPNISLKYVPNLWGAFRIHSHSKTQNITKSYKDERKIISNYYQNKIGNKSNHRLLRVKSYLRKVFYWLRVGQWRYLLNKLKTLY